jgi:quercetin dioxygenase-like cupin family protein
MLGEDCCMSIAQHIRAWPALVAVAVAGSATLTDAQIAAAAAGSAHQGIAVALVGSYWLPPALQSSITALRVEIAPDGFTVRRGQRGFLLAHVLSGKVRAQADDALAVVYDAGESFVEHPWIANSVIENASRSEPASLLVIFVAPPGAPLPVFDR